MLGDQLDVSEFARLSPVSPAPMHQSHSNDKRSSSKRFVQNMQVVLRPSSSSLRQTETIRGVCKNLSQSGCGVVSNFAPRVGDLYCFDVTQEPAHPLHGVHSRCVRCQWIDEEVFECGFAFLSPVELQPSHSSITEDPLV